MLNVFCREMGRRGLSLCFGSIETGARRSGMNRWYERASALCVTVRQSWMSILLISAITATRIGMGISSSIAGPTLLYLANNIRSDVSAVSFTLVGRSFGIMIGAIFGGYLKMKRPDSGQLLYLGISVGISGVVLFAVPWVSGLWVLVLNITIGGVMYGYLDAGLQALILQLWGESGSRVQIQMFHFSYSIGAFVAPIIVQPFLLMSNEDASSSATCPHDNQPFSTNVTALKNGSEIDENFNPVGWGYIIAAMWNFVVCVIMVCMACCNIEGKLVQRGVSSETRPEEPIRDLIWFFVPVTGYFYCSVATVSVFYNFIYSVTLCSDLKFSVCIFEDFYRFVDNYLITVRFCAKVKDASFANSLFWMGLGAGRLTGVLAANYLSPKQIIISSIAGTIIDSFLMALFGEQRPWIAWFVSFSHGFTPAMTYPSGVSWVSQITNVSGTYMFIFSIGNSLSGITMLRLAGYLFDINPFSVMVQVFVLSAINAVFFAWSLHAGKTHLRHVERRRVLQSETVSLESFSDGMSSDNDEVELLMNDRK